MKLLLDTHCWLWWLNEPQKLTSSMQQAISNPDNELFVSVASIWEIAIKVAIGKLIIPLPLAQLVAQQLPIDGINTLDIRTIHALKIEELPAYHQDPFDRILIAQAICENLTIITCDLNFAFNLIQASFFIQTFSTNSFESFIDILVLAGRQ